MQNRNEKNDKYSGIIYASSGAMIGAHYWNEFCYIPNKRMISGYNIHLNNNRYIVQYLPKVEAAQARMIKGAAIIPISAAVFYLAGKSISFFGKSKRLDELSKVSVDKINNRFER